MLRDEKSDLLLQLIEKFRPFSKVKVKILFKRFRNEIKTQNTYFLNIFPYFFLLKPKVASHLHRESKESVH